MLRHACGFALANKRNDTRALQAYLGHRNIQHTVRYTELAPDRTGSSSGVAPSRAEARLNVAETAKTKGLSEDVRSSQARLLSRPPLQVRKREAFSQPLHALAAVSPSDGTSSSQGGVPRTLTRVVSRGDSLWRISRVTYGVGEQYVVVYKANRDRIRNPNLIYPGQTFVLPMKAH